MTQLILAETFLLNNRSGIKRGEERNRDRGIERETENEVNQQGRKQ